MNDKVAVKVGKGIGKMVLGTILSILLGVICIIVGLGLSFTIIGMLIGIPLILFGITGIIASPFVGMGVVTRKTKVCPKCGGTVTFITTLQRMAKCKQCHNYIKVKKGELVS